MDEEDGQKDGRVGASSPTRPAHFAWQQHGHPTSAPVASCNRRYGIQYQLVECRYPTAERAHCITRMPIQIIPVL